MGRLVIGLGLVWTYPEILLSLGPGLTMRGAVIADIKPGYEHANMHMIFDINMDGNLTRKSRFLADGHTTAPPSSITYSSVVSRESVRILFLLASLNDLDIFAYDIGNEYLDAKFREKLWKESGTEFGK